MNFEDEKMLFDMSSNRSTAYQDLAMTLIFLCIQAREQSPNDSSVTAFFQFQLREVLTAADNALESAAKAGNKLSSRVDEKFKTAIHKLNYMKTDLFMSDPNIGRTEAKMIDMSDKSECPSTILCALSVNLDAKPMSNKRQEPTRVVEFRLLNSLPDTHPIVVKQMLGDSPSLQEILWNFSCFKDTKRRLTLRDNPHFYTDLPTLPEAYGNRIEINPTVDFQHADIFYVLADYKPMSVSIQTDQISRRFYNFYCPQNAIIFQDICGRLRGEGVVKASLDGTYCGFCCEFCLWPPVSQLPVPAVPRNPRELQRIITEEYSQKIIELEGIRHAQISPFLGTHRRSARGSISRCSISSWRRYKHPLLLLKCSTGCLPIHSHGFFGICICIGVGASDGPLLVPFPPTSEQPQYSVAHRTHIFVLDNDTLLQIFNCYRLEDEDKWNLQSTWRTLTHVCRRWRYLIYDLSSHLDMFLLLTNDAPPIDTLSHLPPLPLVIDYSDRTGTVARIDEDNIRLGLQRHGHVCRVALRAPSSSLHMWLESMDKPFPRLKDLSLLSTTTDEMDLMLLETLHTPDLRRLALHGIGLPTGLPLLSSTIVLSTLSLTHIGASCYFPPGHLVTQLQGLPRLEELSIGFAIPIPLPSNELELLPPPIPPVTLPNLRRLTFLGVGVYLDNLAAQINTPLLERLSLTLLFELTFSLVNLTEFIHRIGGFGCLMAQVNFNEPQGGVSIYADHYEQQDLKKLSLRVNCKPLDWQIDSATQVCSALGNVLSAVEKLTIDLNVDGMPSEWEKTLDGTLWIDLLLPFNGVKKLHIGSPLALELSQALESDAGGLILELLPELQELEVELKIEHAQNAFFLFVEARESVGRPVHLLVAPMPPPDSIMPHADPGVPQIDPGVPHIDVEVLRIDLERFLKYTNNVGRPYRNQALKLISICQTFIQAQIETFRSYDDVPNQNFRELKSVCQFVEDALKSATEAQKKTSKTADKKFKEAIDALIDYEKKYRSRKTAAIIMAAAKAKDKA